MTNKFRRSMASVLLAASLLFSSQSVIAFADYGSKSDTSDLSPVQESVETVVKDEQTTVSPEEPAKNGEEGEQEKTETPEKPAEGEGEEQDKPETETPETPADPSAVAPTPLVPATPVAPEMGIEPASIEDDGDYDHTADIVTNSPRKYIWSSESFTNTLLGDQFRVILWTQSSNGTELGTIVKDDSAPFYPGTGYRIYSIEPNDPNNWVFAGWTTNVYHKGSIVKPAINADNCTGKYSGYSAFSVKNNPNEPYTKNNTEIRVNAVMPHEGVIVTNKLYYTLCANFDPLVGVVYDSEEGTVSSDLDPYTKQEGYQYKATYDNPATFTIKPTKAGYKPLVNGNECVANTDGTYTYTLPSVTDPTTLNVEFEKDVQENVFVYACYDGVMEKQLIFQGQASRGSKLIDYLKEQELKIKEGYTIEEGWYKKDSFPNEYLFNETDTVSGWTNVYVKCFKNPDENIINNLLDVTLNCENPDHPEEYAKSKTYSDLLPNYYTIGEVKNNDGTYTCDITINPEEYLADYNNVTKTNHILVTTPENLTGIATVTLKYEDGAWKTAESPVTFTVTCKESIPLTPSKPSDDVVKAIMDKISVTVDCTNTTGHDPMNHTLTGAKFTVGDIYSVAPFADQDPDPVILCPVTINNYVSLQNGFITQYNAATNESHTLSSGFIPASIVLTYNKDAQDGKGAWENHDLKNITLSLTCNPTTPGGGGEGTNPGGNGGDNDDDDDRYTGGNTVTRTINDDDVPLNDRPTNTTTIDDEDVPLADLPDDTVTIDDGEVPLKANPSTGDSLPFAAMAAAALSLGGVIVLNRKKK